VSVSPDALTTRFDGPAPEREIAHDLAKKALIAAPVLLIVGTLLWGWQGTASTAFAMALVTVNLRVSAGLSTWAARISVGLMMGVVLFGYLIRLGLILVIVLAVKDQPWVNLVALGIMLIVTQLGLLVWETRYVAASLAFPGLKPPPRNPASSNSPLKDGR
jgi:hypothetical protein